MEPEVTLTFNDGRERRVVVHTRGFTIGRAPDNDLVLNYPNLSRRHAVIESSGGGVRIADCGSQNGTLVNGVPADGSVELRDGDVVTLGGLCDLKVGIRAGSGAGISVEHPSDPFAADEYDFEPPATPPPLPGPSRISAPLIAVVSIILISLAAVALIVFLKPDPTGTADAGKASTKEDDPVINSAGKSRRDDVSRPANTPTGPPAVAGTGPPPADVNTEESAGSDSSEQIRRVAKNFLRRFGDEPAPYISQGGLRDVEETVERLRGSNALREQLGVMGRDGSEVAAQARKAGFDPALIIYAALAETSGGRGGDPKAAARALTQNMQESKMTIGTAGANTSLLLLAACKYEFNPGSERAAHPLIARARVLGGRAKVDVSIARSVWFLREKGGISDEAYNFVLRFMAVGVIARNPRLYAIEADPLPW